jgi:alkylation response protein AidB-like acyl-CoA dehydrogenase
MATIETAAAEVTRDSFFGAPGPDFEIVAKATELRPLIQEHAQEGEDQRRVAEPVVEALQEAGLFHISIPKRWEGQGGNFRTFIEAVSEVARGDGGTGWAVALLNVCTWFGTLYSDQAQEDVFGQNPGARACGIFSFPGGPFQPAKSTPEKSEWVDDGLLVSGEWPYASGSLHADWANLGVKIDENEDGTPVQGLALIPMSDLSIRDTWYVAGMRASGSNTIVAEDVLIPKHRIQPFEDMAGEKYAREWAEEPNYWASFVPVAEIVLVAPQIGLGRAAIDLTLEKGAKKGVSYTVYSQAKDSPAHQIELARAVSQIDAAHLLVARACADIDRAALNREHLDPLTRARVRMDTGEAGRLCREAINRLLSVNGASSFAQVNPLQRIWRDSEIASRHAFVMPEVASQLYGRALFGIEEPIQPF